MARTLRAPRLWHASRLTGKDFAMGAYLQVRWGTLDECRGPKIMTEESSMTHETYVLDRKVVGPLWMGGSC